MKHLKKYLALIFALCIMLGAFSGCGSDTNKAQYVKPETFENVADGEVAKNDYFTMNWNSQLAAVTFKSADGSEWSTIPKSFLANYEMDGVYDTIGMGIDSKIASSMIIDCRKGAQNFTHTSLEKCVNNGGTISSKMLENGNGISVTYYFDEIKVSVTADYYLEDDGFKVSVDPTKIICGGDDIVTSVTPAPFLCSADVDKTYDPNEGKEEEAEDEFEDEFTDEFADEFAEEVPEEPTVEAPPSTIPMGKDDYNYVVVPSGSGALMYCNTRNSFSPRTYLGEVYGEDPSVEKWEDLANTVAVTMHFYGGKRNAINIDKSTGFPVAVRTDKEEALCAIIEQGENSCSVGGETNPFQGYFGRSYAVYNVTGYNYVYSNNAWRPQYNDIVEPNLEPLVLGFYPLKGEDASYMGIAKRYKKFLTEKHGMTKSQSNSLLTVKLLGEYVEDDLFLGIPTTKNVSLTSYAEAQKIVEELNKISGGSLIVDMYGYGEGGINANKLAGGYSLTGATGDSDDLEAFLKYTKDSNISTYFNFDTVMFYESGNGYSISDDTAVNENGIPAPVRQFWFSTRARLEAASGGKVGGLVSREQLGEAVKETVELADEYGITGLAYDTIGNIAYSDYIEDDNDNAIYPLKNGYGDQVAGIIKETKESSKSVLIDGANAYAAAAADIIAGCPAYSNTSTAFDREIPLYQIVFQGTKSNSIYSINMTANQNTQFLKAIETGSGLSFTLMGNYYGELRKQYVRGLGSAVYSDNKDRIASFVERSKAYLTSVADASIVSHQYLTDNVVKTVFDNQVSVIVNYGDKDYKSDLGIVKANDFLYK